jgi:hypothetical protein
VGHCCPNQTFVAGAVIKTIGKHFGGLAGERLSEAAEVRYILVRSNLDNHPEVTSSYYVILAFDHQIIGGPSAVEEVDGKGNQALLGANYHLILSTLGYAI